jgi:predicted  nucleic acid-binding Zn-ribbon protein
MNEQRNSSGDLPSAQQPEQPEARDSQSALLREHDTLNAEWRNAASEMARVLKESAGHSDHSAQHQQRLEELHAKLGMILQRQWEIERTLIGL